MVMQKCITMQVGADEYMGIDPLSEEHVKGVAERQGFEPWIPCGIHAFQACAFSHSAISPNGFLWRYSHNEKPLNCLNEFTRECRWLHIAVVSITSL
jgi:hypothetical protein